MKSPCRKCVQVVTALSVLWVGTVCSSIAQENQDKRLLSNIDSIRAARIEFGRSVFTPFIAPSYSPELQFLMSAGGLYTFKTEKDNQLLERSVLPFSVGYSSNGSLQVSAKLTLYGRGDKTRGEGEFWLKSMPDNYWGVGFENGRDRQLSDSTTTYQREWWKIYYKLVRRFGDYFFWGGSLDINSTEATELNPLMAEDSAILRDGTDIRNGGLGLTLQYDSRDLIVNAYEGLFIDVSAIFYSNIFRGQNNYQSVEIDYRQYKNVGRPRQTLAWQVLTRSTFGDVPWPELSQVGTPFDLRGYRWGRFRDEDMIYGLVEYRHMFARKRPNKKGSLDSRSGFVTWVGLGSIGEQLTSLEGLIPNYGVGYRFETQTRMNVRIDYGFGADSNAIYITFNEAF